MRKILLALGILFLSCHAFAAGGTCPSGSIALQESTNSLVTLSTLGVTSCVFVSAAGADTNTGLTESSPWLHAPGMTSCANNCSSFSMAAGIGIIFRPGDHWHLGNSGSAPYVGSAHWTVSTAGNSTNPVYIGTDPNWSGGSGTRFVLDGDNGLWTSPNALPASCPTHDFVSSSGLSLAAFNIVDNMEVTGVCSGYTGIAVNPMFIGAGNSDILARIYYHGWQVTATSTNLYGVATGGSSVIWTNGIIDGSDSPHWATGNANCTANGNWQCATGQGFYDRMFKIEYSVFRYTANHGVMIDTTSIHDNLIEFEETAPTSTMTNAQHADAFMVFSGTLQSFYNNVTRHNYATQIMYANVNSGGTLYIFNNVWYDNTRYGSGSAAADNCVNLAAQTSGGGQTLYVYNNTFDNDTDDTTGGGCQISIYGTSGGNSNGFTWTGNVNAANNHLIGYSNLSSLFNTTRSTGVTITLNDNGGQVIQATATARSQGFVQSTTPVGDFPPNNTVATIGAGGNQTSLCSTFSADSALCSSTSGGAGASSGVYSFPNETIVSRPSSGVWNSGAFTPASVGPSFTIAPSTIPSNHSTNITLTFTGSGTSWNGSTAFSASGVSGITFGTCVNTTATAETCKIKTGSSTGTVTVTDTTDSITSNVTISNSSFSISPNSASPGSGGCTTACQTTITFTGTNTVWSADITAGNFTSTTLFTISGGTGTAISSCSITSNTAATCTLQYGSGGNITITDNSTTTTATFTVATLTLPTVTTGTAGAVTSSTIPITGSSYTCTGSCATITSEGVCYSTVALPTTPCTSDGTTSPFNSLLTGLAAGTTYRFRAFATNSVGTAYGSVSSFTTPSVLYVKGAGASGSSSSNTFTFSYTASAVNNAVVFSLYCHGASIPTSATLTAPGWTASTIINATANSNAAGALFGAVAPNTTAATFTAEFFTGGSTPVPCASFDAYIIGEFTGNSTIGGTATFPVSGASGASAGGCNQTAANVTPTSVNNAVWIACYDSPTGVNTPWLAGATDGAGGDVSEYQTLTGGLGVAQTPSFAGTTGNYVVLGAAISPAASAPWSGIIDPSRAVDWTGSGVTGGIPVRVTQCGSTINASGDQTGASDVSAINSALQSCAPNTYLLLGGSSASPQTFYICGGLTFGSPQNVNGYTHIINNVSIRGGGPLATILKATCPAQQELAGAANAIAVAGVESWSPTTYPMDCGWTAGYAQGSTLITLSGCTTNPAVGMIVVLDQRNSSIGLTGCMATSTTVTCTTSIPHNYIVNVGGAGHTCPDALNDCVFVGSVADTSGTKCANGDSLYDTGCNSIGATGSVPITQVTSTTFSYSVSSLITHPAVGSSTAGTGFSDVDNGGVWNTQIVHGTNDETAGSNGRNCPDPFNVNTCASGEISNRSQAEVKMIVGVCTGSGTGTGTGVSACQAAGQVILDRGLFHNSWATSQAPGLWSMDCSPNSSGGSLCSAAHNGSSCSGCTATSNYVQGAGIESLTIDGNNDGGSDTNSLVEFYRAYNSWMKNVRCLYGDRNCVWVRDGSAHLQFQDSYFGYGKGSAVESYGVEFFGDVGDVLASNNIFHHVPAGLQYGGCWGCVAAYNYMLDDGDTNTNIMFTMLSLNHDENGYNLAEGNNTPFSSMANVHGTNTGPITVFRSRLRGQTPTGPIKTSTLVNAEVTAFIRGANYVGNVMGWVNNSALSGGSITAPGQTVYWGNLTSQGNLVWLLNKTAETGTFVPTDVLVGKSLYTWGNFDVISGPVVAGASSLNPNGVIWAGPLSSGNGITPSGCAAGATFTTAACFPEVPGAFTYLNAQPVPVNHSLPPSFYYSATPSFWRTAWGTPQWPAIGPDVSTSTAGAPDCVPVYNISTNPSGCMSDNIPSQLAANNLGIDANYILPTTITSASWTSGTVTWTGSFTMEQADTFKVSGSNGGAWDTGPDGQQTILISGPQRPFQPALTQGVNIGGTTGTLSGSYYIVLTRVQSGGQETHTGPGTSVTMSGGNNSLEITAPACGTLQVSPLPVCSNTAQNGGGLSVASDAAVSYRVYAGVKGTAVTQLCLQSTNAVGPPGLSPTGADAVMSSLVTSPCTHPPATNQQISTKVTSYQAANPNNSWTTGTMTFPLVLSFDAATAYPNAYFIPNAIQGVTVSPGVVIQ